MATINLILAYPMTKFFSVIGLCTSIMIAYVVRTIMMDVIFYKTLHIDIFKFFKDSYMKIIPSLALAVIFCFLFTNYYTQSGYIGFIVKTTVCTLVYILSVWFFAMDNSEKELLSTPIRKIITIK